MSDDRDIKPRSPVPAAADALVAGAPGGTVPTAVGAVLAGVRRAHYRRVLREGFGRAVGEETTYADVARVYGRLRPSPSVVCDRHFTTDAGRRGLRDLAAAVAGGEGDAGGARGGEGGDGRLAPEGVHEGSCLDHAARLPAGSVQTVVTSPPYWGVRVYPGGSGVTWADGVETPLGGESTPEAYLRHLLEVCLRLRRVLTETGTIWLNLGDVYNTRGVIRSDSGERAAAVQGDEDEAWHEAAARRHSAGHEYLKDKDLAVLPARLATGLERCGFYVRAAVTWRKDTVVPEPVGDRPTVGHETVLLVAPNDQYEFDEGAWRASRGPGRRGPGEAENLRTVWRLRSAAGEEDHGAQFPVALPARCITLTTDPGDRVYDPFLGSGTTAVAAERLGRTWVGSEVVPEYAATARERAAAARRDGAAGGGAGGAAAGTVASSLDEFADSPDAGAGDDHGHADGDTGGAGAGGGGDGGEGGGGAGRGGGRTGAPD